MVKQTKIFEIKIKLHMVKHCKKMRGNDFKDKEGSRRNCKTPNYIFEFHLKIMESFKKSICWLANIKKTNPNRCIITIF